MLRFLRENWVWIAAPVLLVVVLAVVLLLVTPADDGGFIYPIF